MGAVPEGVRYDRASYRKSLPFVYKSKLLRVRADGIPQFAKRYIWSGAFFMVFFSGSYFVVLYYLPLYFQAVKLESASLSGFRLGGPSIALTICGVSCGFIMTATGRMKWLIVVGTLSMLIGSVCLSAMWDGIPTWLATVFLIPSSVGQGLGFPATSLAVLATSTQQDQAVMTSTLLLWRSLGVVMGVSFSSLILQNALTAYLNALVTGRHKDEVRVRYD